ncbi:MAG: quinoprotein relay system zinc metallohydrolase 1 [Burkholderiales bacterium]
MTFSLRFSSLFLIVAAAGAIAQSDEYNYRLTPEIIADGVYVFIGKTEDFSWKNGGNVVNTGFVVTNAGVVVIDTGPSKRYGEQMRAAIKKITPQPIVKVFNTHHHPDHIFGNQAYADVGVSALAQTIIGEKTEGGALADNMYRMNGEWMRDTDLSVASKSIEQSTKFTLGERSFSLHALSGHTGGDLAVMDESSGVIFSGDLIFNQRAATTPHADIPRWIQAIDYIDNLSYKKLIPGHGPVITDHHAVKQMREYLVWLSGHLKSSAEQGADMTDVLSAKLPAMFAAVPMAREEYQRSVVHLYPKLEQAVLAKAAATK